MFRYFSNGGVGGWSRLSLRDSGVIQAGRDSARQGFGARTLVQSVRQGAVVVTVSGAAGCHGARPTNDWIHKGHVSLLKHALRLSRASGIPIEEFVGDEDSES